jgi:hypothetical protein
VLAISLDAKKTMLGIPADFKLRDNKIAEPDMYLGATLSKMELEGNKWCWAMSPEQYKEELARKGRRLPTKCVTPFLCDYAPWLETSLELKADGMQQFQELIEQLCWAVEIGQVIVLPGILLISSNLAMP